MPKTLTEKDLQKIERDTAYDGEVAQANTDFLCAEVRQLRPACRELQTLKEAIERVVTQQADDLCWMDVYVYLGKLVGKEITPQQLALLPKRKMLANCELYVDSLQKGCGYKPEGLAEENERLRSEIESKAGLRLLVMGSMEWRDELAISQTIKLIHSVMPVTVLIEGEAEGADLLARKCGLDLGLSVEPYHVDQSADVKTAVAARNQRMLDEGKPGMCVVFHDSWEKSWGTKDMVTRAKNAGIKAVLVSHSPNGLEVSIL